MSAGNAEPPLLLFETLALAGIVFGSGRRSLDAVVALGLAGAVWTKVEGAASRRSPRPLSLVPARRSRPMEATFRISLPALALLASWIMWAAHHGILQAYLGATYGAFSAARWKLVLGGFSRRGLRRAHLPWVVLLFLPPLRSATATFAYFSGRRDLSPLHPLLLPARKLRPDGVDPMVGQRLLMTPLLFLFFASAAAARKGEPS